MDETLNNQEDSGYATPFNVDFSGPKSKNFFTEYTIRVLALPESIKNILMDSSTAGFIEENLGPTFNLSPEQKKDVTRIIRDVLLGDISINAMASKISENLEIDPTTAYQVQSKIVSELFGPIINDLQKSQAEPPPQRPAPLAPKYVPAPPRKPEPTASPGNVIDLRNPK